MKVETDSLKRISTVAHESGVSVQAVYKWIAKGSVEAVTIDGVTYIKR